MSLYNAIFGENQFAGALLMTLGVSQAQVPRYRDCYLNPAGEVVIYTRTGGRNRAGHERCQAGTSGALHDGPFNDDLRKLKGYLRDEDDSLDSTFAYFYFEPNDEFADVIAEIREKQGVRDPNAAWQKLLKDMNEGKDTPEVRNALETARRIDGELRKGKGIIGV